MCRALLAYSLLLLSARQSVLLLNPKNGKWESFPIPERNGQRYVLQEFVSFSPGDILLISYNLAKTEEKVLWRFHKRRIEALSLPAEKTTSSAFYRAIADASGNTYLFKPGLLQVFDPSGKQMYEIPVPKSLGGTGTTMWADFDPENALICLTDFRFFKLNRTGPAFLPHPANRFLTSNQVILARFTMEKNGSFWACVAAQMFT